MTDELKPVRCGCGGEAESALSFGYEYYVMCHKCGTRSDYFLKEVEAIEAWNRAMGAKEKEKNKMTGGAWYARRTKNDEREAVVHLDRFCKAFCIDVEVTDDLEFRCKDCTFQTESGNCLVKMFKCIYAPDYKEFGAMGDL